MRPVVGAHADALGKRQFGILRAQFIEDLAKLFLDLPGQALCTFEALAAAVRTQHPAHGRQLQVQGERLLLDGIVQVAAGAGAGKGGQLRARAQQALQVERHAVEHGGKAADFVARTIVDTI